MDRRATMIGATHRFAVPMVPAYSTVDSTMCLLPVKLYHAMHAHLYVYFVHFITWAVCSDLATRSACVLRYPVTPLSASILPKNSSRFCKTRVGIHQGGTHHIQGGGARGERRGYTCLFHKCMCVRIRLHLPPDRQAVGRQ